MRLFASQGPAEKPPRLVVRFAFFTALGLALAAVAIAFFVRAGSTAQAQQHAIERARFATEAVLKRELRPSDLTSRPAPARRRQLDRLLRESVLREGIVGLTLYDASGRFLYATGRGTPGAATEEHVREALRGVAVSTVGASEAGAEQVLRTHVPVVLGEQRTAGIATFEQDYGPIEAAGRRSAWLIAGVLEGLLLLLLLALAPVLLRVTARIRHQIAEIEHAATHDEPTGTANRIGLRRAVEAALSSNAPGALLVVDIDGFSELNEAFGLDGGDAVLFEVALRLRWELADCEPVARLGADEFAVLLDSATQEAIEDAAARVTACLAPPILVDGVRVPVTVSMGAAVLGEHDDFASVTRHAGLALAAAEEEGDGEVRIYEPAYEARDASRAALLTELRAGLENGELLVHFQPQVDLATRQVRGVEALLRWQHPKRGFLTAGEFVQEAEQSGLSRELRQFVLESSARCWRNWNDLGLCLEVSVNLSAIDLLDASLPDEVAVLLDAYEIPPWNLVLEITERTLVVDERRTRGVIDSLRQLGVRIAIDDFGVGYSSLASLQRFPIQVVKLDRSLLADAPGEPAAEAIVRGSIELAHAIGATVVAEGIERSDQWELVHALGCEIAQGYLVGHPVPADEIASLLQVEPAVTHEVAA